MQGQSADNGEVVRGFTFFTASFKIEVFCLFRNDFEL